MSLAVFIIFVVIAYLLGSIPSGILVARALGGVDPRTIGSKNIGATNVSRSAGKRAGVITLLGDLLKGAIPTFIAFRLNHDPLFVSLVGIAAFAGHLFPIYLKFKGGKGVATACGVMLVICPLAILLSALVFFIIVGIKKYVSLASIISAGMLPVFLSFSPRGKDYVFMGVAISVLIIIKHKENIKRLIEGTENKIGGKPKA